MNLITSLSQKLNKNEAEVSHFLSGAPRKYKVYTIPKRTKGVRTIAQPSKELKIYQRAFIELYDLKCHPSAMAYQKSISIKDNALLHCKNQYLLKMDFENFFNSIKPAMVMTALNEMGLIQKQSDVSNLARLLFWQPSRKNPQRLILSVGAPSSPALSNLCMYEFDEIIANFCDKERVVYSRYADDLTFSTEITGALFKLPSMVKDVLVELFETSILINNRKTAFASKAHNRHITGITITNQSTLSLGRNRKRYIKHLVHQYILGSLDREDKLHLKGLISFASHIEPTFIISLRAKYSAAIVDQLMGGMYEHDS